MKRIICLFLAILMCLSVPIVAFADSPFAAEKPGTESSAAEREDPPMRPEETVWYFRTYNGMNQMRLWSITYRKWLTDWIDIGPAD